MRAMVMSRLHSQLIHRNQIMNSGLSIQDIDGNCIRIDKFDTNCKEKMFLKYSPIMFFLVSYDVDTLKLELMTYNEQVFDIFDFSAENSDDVFNFVENKFKNFTFSHCSGVKKENIKPRKLKRYLSDNDTLFEKFGDNLIFRSIRCKRILENTSSMDLCSYCKNWLISKETNTKLEEPPDDLGDSLNTEDLFDPNANLPEIKVKFEESDEDFSFDKSVRKSNKRSSNEVDQSNQTNSKRQRSKKSHVWLYFNPSVTQTDCAECKLCQVSIGNKNGNTTGMWFHMKRCHEDILESSQDQDFLENDEFNGLEDFQVDNIDGGSINEGFLMKSEKGNQRNNEEEDEDEEGEDAGDGGDGGDSGDSQCKTDYKKHECPESGCTERFRIFQGKLMRKHLEIYHGKSLSEPREMFPCQKCDKKFKTYEIMQKHLKGVHESMHVPCYICAKLVKEGTPMEHHIKYVHLRPNQFE